MKARRLAYICVVSYIVTMLIVSGLTIGADISESSLATHSPIRIDGNSDFTAGNGVNAGSGTSGDPYIIDNWEINATGYGYGIYVGNTTDYFIIRDCSIYNASGVGGGSFYGNKNIILYNLTNAIIINNTFDALYGGDTIGIQADFTSGSIISNNTITNCSSGIYFVSSNNSVLSNNPVSNSTFGIRLSKSFNNTILDNNLNHNYHNIYSSATTTPVQNNTIIGNSITNGDYGVYVYTNHENNTISNNIFFNISYGVYFNKLSDYNTISNNSFIDGNIIIYLKESSKHNTIFNNTLVNNTHGIYIRLHSDNNNIYNNNITNSTSNGIYLTFVSYNAVSNNNVHDSNYGVRMHYSTTYNTIINNTIFDNAYGIYMTQTDNNTMYNNHFINNTNHAYSDSPDNYWNGSYALGIGGNYWDNYTGSDAYSGVDQDQAGSDGFGDTPFIFTSGQDNYPIMSDTPTADAGDDVTVGKGLYTFDATGSFDIEGEIVNYTWNFTYDETDVELYDANPSFDFQIEGDYVVTLNATDDVGDYDIDTITITVDETTSLETTVSALISLIPLIILLVVFTKLDFTSDTVVYKDRQDV